MIGYFGLFNFPKTWLSPFSFFSWVIVSFSTTRCISNHLLAIANDVVWWVVVQTFGFLVLKGEMGKAPPHLLRELPGCCWSEALLLQQNLSSCCILSLHHTSVKNSLWNLISNGNHQWQGAWSFNSVVNCWRNCLSVVPTEAQPYVSLPLPSPGMWEILERLFISNLSAVLVNWLEMPRHQHALQWGMARALE